MLSQVMPAVLKRMDFQLFRRSRRNLVDVSAGTAVNPTDPLRPFTSWALKGSRHAG